MKRMTWFVLACFAFCTAAVRADDALGIGDAAPKLEVNEFVKGEPVKEFKSGQVYVVEFWATWCGPCRATIPHLSKLQKEYGDKVTFIGVSVWERDASKVVPFVKEMGEKMEYRVCTDKVGKDEDAADGPMAKKWMTAAGQDGIPAAFIVNGEGKIAWIGHPAKIDESLAAVVAGKYDLAKAKEEFQKDRAMKAKMQKVFTELNRANREGPNAVVKVLDKTFKETPEMEQQLGSLKLKMMVNDKESKEDDILKYGERLVSELYKNDSANLNEIAWVFVEPEKKSPASKALLALALKAAQQGVEASKGKDSAVMDTLACAYYANGDKAKAIECLEKALKLSPDDEELKGHLELFKRGSK